MLAIFLENRWEIQGKDRNEKFMMLNTKLNSSCELIKERLNINYQVEFHIF